MSNSSHLESIFFAALEKPSPAERQAYLDEVCAGDAELCRRVERMLAAQAEAGSFLESPAADQVATTDHRPITEQPGTVIGPYKLLQQIGEGGMGVVFMAEQSEPIQRTVALKIIKPGMDTRQVIARFEAERQALAMMDHPNIAKVLDAGTTASGRPYFVMELVKGVPITKYCDDKLLSVRERLELMSAACNAVQHAHQKGIIHRDLKPSNILVAEYDDHPVPKVIDFGVAKATVQKLTERTMFTEFGQLVGTFEYMSPEQTKLNQLDVDTRSDIYSLGVLLYELLTGSTPFEHERLREAAFDEVLRIIREDEPPKPSTRLSTSETLPTIAANRHTEPAKLNRDIRNELDWIVMKCLEKDRNRRYETANGLASDIERYLRDEAVQACPPSASYRFRKFARRNKIALVVASAAFATLLLLVLGLAISNRLIAAQRARAEAERQRAEENLLRARVAVRDILFESALGRGEWSQLPESLRKKFAEKTTAFYESLLQEGSSSPSLQYETAVGYRSLAFLHNSLKEPNKAEDFARQSIKLLDRLATEHPGVIEYQNQQAYSHFILGTTLTHAVDKGVAEREFQRSANLYETLISQRPDVSSCYVELALCYNALIKVQKGRGATKDAEQTVNRLLSLSSKVPPDSTAVAEVQSSIALALLNAGRLREAVDASDAAVRATDVNDAEQRRKIADMCLSLSHKALNGANRDARMAEAAARNVIKLVPEYGMAYANLAMALRDQDRLDEAVAASRKGIELQPYYANGHYELGDILRRQGKFDEAVAACRNAIKIQPDNARAKMFLARALLAQENGDAAIVAWGKAIELRPNEPATLNSFAWWLATVDDAKHRDPVRAVELAKKAVEMSPHDGRIWSTLGIVEYRAGEWQPAIDALEKSMKERDGVDAVDACNWYFLAMAHWQLDHKDEARKWYDKAVEWTDKNQPQNEDLHRIQKEAEQLLKTSDQKPTTKPQSK